jgi:Glycosyltransferase Family 4
VRIALLGPVWFPVPPPRCGGIESVVALLGETLSAAGHDVIVFASGDSETSPRVSWIYARRPSERIGEPLPELHHALACFERAHEFDVISDHSAPFAAALGGLLTTPVLHIIHGPLDGKLGDRYEHICPLTHADASAARYATSPMARGARAATLWVSKRREETWLREPSSGLSWAMRSSFTAIPLAIEK